ncbi:MAG: proline iminopeptidase-family hydrolase [Chloroflexi bacterium]|nr:proline iminopeptidase-family hydrolase [Chloroflexota bacterium]
MAQRNSDIKEGFVPVPGGKVWYRMTGSGNGVPLLTFHGGPGAGHDYLEPLEALADDRPVILYDQLGCGNSDKPDDVSLWRIERYVEEVAALRKALSLDRVFLYGHSWGGILAIEYMMGAPAGVVGLILGSSVASAAQYARETAVLKAQLSPETVAILRKHEAVGDYHNPEYEEAMMEFYTRHVCRLDPWPEPLMRTLNNVMSNPAAYETMQGPNEFTINGNLKEWDRTERLGEIWVPTLVTVGRYDEITLNCAETLHRGIPGSELVVFENSAHMAMLEETARYLEVLRQFIGRVERR